MKTYFPILFALLAIPAITTAQVPNGFNYQAIARDASGNPIPGATLQVELILTADSLSTTIYWDEIFNPVTTNSFGLINVALGQGVRQASSTVASLSSVNWNIRPLFVRTKIYYLGSWKDMGSARLWSVPYAMMANVAATANGISVGQPYLSVTGTTPVMDSALFVVRNNTGQIIFAVYNEGVRIYVDNGAKSTNKGGFAVGGFGSSKAASQEYLRVTGDSTRIYVNPSASKGTKGGFAIGGFGSKSSDSYMNLTPNNYFIGEGSGNSISSGLYNTFAGYQSGSLTTSGSTNVFLGYQSGYSNTSGSTDVLIGNQSGYSDSTGSSNVIIGNQAGFMNNASYNSYIGYQAGYSTTTGGYNSFMGYKAGYANTTGYYNAFIGFMAGLYNTDGTGNTFLGEAAGLLNKHGSTNTFVGTEAGYSNNANFNTFIGYDAGYADTSGYENIFIGYYSGNKNTSGTGNTVIGDMAGQYYEMSRNTFIGDMAGRNTGGNDDVFMGYQTGYANGGSKNVYIGTQAGSQTSGSGNVAIGYNAGYYLSGDNELIIENSNNSTTPLIYGDFSAKNVVIGGTNSNGKTFYVNGLAGGTASWATVSDFRYKKNIVPLSDALEDVMRLQGVRYNWKRSDFPQLNFPDGEQLGVIAQDVEKVIPEVVYTAPDGYKSVSYEKIVPVLIEAIKAQQKQIDQLKSLLSQIKPESSK